MGDGAVVPAMSGMESAKGNPNHIKLGLSLRMVSSCECFLYLIDLTAIQGTFKH